MFKQICLYTACLLGLPLFSETIQNVQFEFPPSNSEWTQFVIEDSTFVDPQDPNCLSEIKMYTHQEGENCEVFLACYMTTNETEEEEEEENNYTLETIQSDLNLFVGQFLPNHKMIIKDFKETETEGFLEWEVSDGLRTVMNGYTRGFSQNEKFKSFAILTYATTANATEDNKVLWTDVLEKAKFIK